MATASATSNVLNTGVPTGRKTTNGTAKKNPHNLKTSYPISIKKYCLFLRRGAFPKWFPKFIVIRKHLKNHEPLQRIGVVERSIIVTKPLSRKKAKNQYKKKVKRISVDFYPTEANLWNHIESQPQKQTYIKNLIRADLANQPQHRVCPNCKSAWYHRETICPNCGTNLTEE